MECKNRWCKYQTHVTPACATVRTLDDIRDTTGGITGRGVTPCPFGYLDRIQPDGRATVTQYEATARPSDILFQPNRPGWLPPQGDPRPMWRIGYQWRN